jgi:hypothetical protein
MFQHDPDEEITQVEAYETLAQAAAQWQARRTRENLGLPHEETTKNPPSVHEK